MKKERANLNAGLVTRWGLQIVEDEMNEIQDIYESMRERYLDQRWNAYCLLISHTPVFSNNLSLNSLQLPSLPYCSSPSDGKLKIEQGSSRCSSCASVNHHPFAITTCESPRQSFTYLPPCVPTRSANRRQLSCHVSETESRNNLAGIAPGFCAEAFFAPNHGNAFFWYSSGW